MYDREKYKNGYVKNDDYLCSKFTPSEGLLALYPIDIIDKDNETEEVVAKDVIGFGLWFPKSSKDTTVDCIVNSVYLNPENRIEEDEE